MMAPTEIDNVAFEPTGTEFKPAEFRPRFLPEVVSFSFFNGLIVDGTERLHVFQGRASQRLLPALIKLMDGSRTVRQLADAIPGARTEHVRNAILLLSRNGLVENAVVDPASVSSSSDTLSFLRRICHSRLSHVRPEEAYAKLSKAEVAIVHSDVTMQHGIVLRSMLRNSGMENLSFVDSGSGVEVLKRGDHCLRPMLVCLSSDIEDRGWTADIDDWCQEEGLSWLHAMFDYKHGFADLGPFFDGRVNACYRCFLSTHCGQPIASPREGVASAADWCFWLSLVASEVIYLASGIGRLVTGVQFQRYALPQWSSRALRWPRIPGCARCRPIDLRVGEERTRNLETAVVFEDYAGTQSRLFAVEKDFTEHQVNAVSPFPANHMVQSRKIRLSSELPKLEQSLLGLLQDEAPDLSSSIDLRDLGSILLLAGGIREVLAANIPSRWAPSAGNLGSVELCVIANRVQGLAKGVHFYLPREHALANFERRGQRLPPEEWIARSILWSEPTLPDAVVLFLGAYGRLAQKYDEFAYRLIQFDAGAAMSQLLLVARTLGISSRIATLWADDLCEDQLNIDPVREQCTGIVALSANGMKTLPDFGLSTLVHKNAPPSARRPAGLFKNQSTHQVLNSLRHESYRLEADLARQPFIVPAELVTHESSAQTQIRLPSPAKGGRLLGDVLATRRSVRRYPLEAVSLNQVSTMLQGASEGDSRDFPDEWAASLELSFLVLAFRVEGLEAAVYTYDSHSHGLNYHRPVPPAQHVSQLFVQDEFAGAPVVFWISGNLAAAVARHGSFGHRQLLFRAGMAAHRVWMAGIATGLSGCIVAGLVLGAAREYLGLEGYRRASLLAVAAGASRLQTMT